MRKNLSIIMFMLPLCILSIIVLVCIYFVYKTEHIHKFTNDKKIELDYTKYNIETRINTLKYHLASIGAEIKDNYTPSQIKNYLNSVVKFDSSFINIYYGSLLPMKLGGIFINVPKDVPDDFDHTTREWFYAAIKTNDTYISKPYIDVVSKKLAVAFSKSVYSSENKLKGVVGMDFDNMSGIFEDYIEDVGGNLDIAAIDGSYIVHTNEDYILNTKYNIFVSSILSNFNKDELDYSGKIHILDGKWSYLTKINNTDWIMLAYGDINILNNKFNILIFQLILIFIFLFSVKIVLFTKVIVKSDYCSEKIIDNLDKINLSND